MKSMEKPWRKPWREPWRTCSVHSLPAVEPQSLTPPGENHYLAPKCRDGRIGNHSLNVAIYGNGCSNGCSNMRCNDIFIILIIFIIFIIFIVIIFIVNAFSPKHLTEMQTTYAGEQRTAVWREHGTAIRSQTMSNSAQGCSKQLRWTAMVTMGSPWQSMAVLVRWLSYFSSQSCLAPRLFFRTLLGNVENCWNFTKRCENSNVHAFAYCAHIWYSHKSCMDTQLSSEVWQAWSLGLDGSWFSAEFSTAFLSFDFIHWKCALTSKHQPTTVDFDLSESIISIGVYRSLLHFYSNIITRPVYPNWTSPQL